MGHSVYGQFGFRSKTYIHLPYFLKVWTVKHLPDRLTVKKSVKQEDALLP